MKIECTPEELKKLIKNEQTECKSECSLDKITSNLSELMNSELSAKSDNGLKGQ